MMEETTAGKIMIIDGQQSKKKIQGQQTYFLLLLYFHLRCSCYRVLWHGNMQRHHGNLDKLVDYVYIVLHQLGILEEMAKPAWGCLIETAKICNPRSLIWQSRGSTNN